MTVGRLDTGGKREFMKDFIDEGIAVI